MIKTLSLCPICYRKIQADINFQNGMVVMTKECPEHGPFSAIVEKDIQHFSNFYQFGTLGNNNSIIIHTHNQCNMNCNWCYYPMGKEMMHPFSYYNSILTMYQGYSLLMSGGEPTLRPDFFDFVAEADYAGWDINCITNMIKLGDDEFFENALNSPLNKDGMMRFAMSMQHPKNYSKDILMAKVRAIENLEKHGKKAMCAMFSITSLDELDYIRSWYDSTKMFYPMLRIRTMFSNWENKGDDNKIWLSDLHKAFLHKFSDLHPRTSVKVEKSNIYCLYMEMDGGMQVSLSSSPTVENIDYHACSRPVYMLAEDGRCYPVPICQIISEGTSLGYKDGYKIGGSQCG